MRKSIPYLVAKRDKTGTRWYWQPSAALRAAGWQTRRLAGGIAYPVAAELAAIEEAGRINAELADWYAAGRDAAPGRPADTLAALIAGYRASPAFADLAFNTRRTYAIYFPVLEEWAGDARAATITPKNCRRLYEAIAGTRRAPKRPGAGRMAIAVGASVFKWARTEDLATGNPFAQIGVRGSGKGGRLWTPEAVDAFVAEADRRGHHSIGSAILFDAWAGQRPGDVLAVRRSQYRNGTVDLTQTKTGARVIIPIDMVPAIADRLAKELARADARQVTPIALFACEATGQPWTAHAFQAAFIEIRDAAAAEVPELDGILFRHLRHTAVTRLAEAGATSQQIAAITGHRLATISRILEHYLVRTTELARQAFAARLEREGNKNLDGSLGRELDGSAKSQ